jgi:tetratricopeptide (TPR) repeat protein
MVFTYVEEQDMHKTCGKSFIGLILVFFIGVSIEIPRGHATELTNSARVEKQGDKGVNLVLRWSSPVEIRHVLQGQDLILVFNLPLDEAIHGILSSPLMSGLVKKQEIGYDSLRLSLAADVIAKVETFVQEARINLSISHSELSMTKDREQSVDWESEQIIASILVTLERSEQSEELENEHISKLIQLGAYKQALPYMRKRATHYGGDWFYRYADVAKKANQSEKLAELLTIELERDDLLPFELEERVWVLIEEQPLTSITFLRKRALQDPIKWVDYYAHALGKLRDGNEQLVDFLDRVLSRSDLSDDDRKVLLSHLFNAGGQQQVRVHLKKIAELGNPSWVDVYSDLLYDMREDQELQVFFSFRGRDPTVSIEERRRIFSTLLSFGNKSAALSVLKTIAVNADPNGRDVQELLFLWGPRPGAAQIEWLAERAKRANLYAHRTAWLQHLINSGGSSRAVELIETEFGTKNAELRNVHINALYALGQDEALQKALRSAIAVESDLSNLVNYAETAQQRNFLSLAESAWQVILEKYPGHIRAKRQLGILAFEQGRLAMAQTHLTAYLDNEKEDFEATFILAETLRLQKHSAKATHLYVRALKQIRTANRDGIYVGLTEAKVLSRLGQLEASKSKFNFMLQKYPADRVEILATYAQTLIDKRRYKEALDVLYTQ